MIQKAGCICTAIKLTQEARMSFYRRDCSPSKHNNFLCIVTNKGFFLWWWDDCTWSSLSSTVKAVTSEKIEHKKGLVYWPCLPLQKKVLQPLCFISNQERKCFRNEVYLKTSVLWGADLSHHVIGLVVGLFSKCVVDCMLERRAGALKVVF
jgi:hypothetical protein